MTSEPQKSRGFVQTLFSRMLHGYFLMSRGLTLGVRAIVRAPDGKFLLVRHTYTPGWHFPGGGVEKGETTVAALSKELLQETGLQLSGTPRLHGVFHNGHVSKRDHVLVYICDAKSHGPKKVTSPEIAEIAYFALSDLPESIDPGTLRRIREIVDGEAVSEAW
jgi:8-oxo-dGTP pyrophosphatase MutT (NUDIX family)